MKLDSNSADFHAALKDRIKSRIRIPKAELFGRVRELDELHQFLAEEGRSVIWGLSGYGKTQLAIHYIHKFRVMYSSVLWIDASNEDSLLESFEDIALQLRRSENSQQTLSTDSVSSNARHHAAIEEVIRWLSRDAAKSWLMVFDSVDRFAELAIRKYLPDCGHGHFIITTTRSDLHFALNFRGISLDGVDEDAGSNILLRCLNNDLPDQLSMLSPHLLLGA